MPNVPKTITTIDGHVLTVDMSLVAALVYKGFDVTDCYTLDADEINYIYIYKFSDNQEISKAIRDFYGGNVHLEPNVYWETITSLHEKYHKGGRI